MNGGLYSFVKTFDDKVGWAVGDAGKGRLWMQNGNGAYIQLVGARRGLSLTMGADGVHIQLGS